MPELPEVENMRILLLPCCNVAIKKVIVNNFNFRLKINPSFISDIEKSFITNITRRGKFLFFTLNNQKCIVMHAGMSGKFIVNSENTFLNHDHVIFYLDNGLIIKYNDPRRFGLALSFNSYQEALAHNILKNIAIDALDGAVSANYLFAKLQKLKLPIKNALLNQSIIAGIGNIYASEILYYANISPLRLSKSISLTECQTILQRTVEILNKSIRLGGSTLRDYALPNGSAGGFQNTFAVYNKEGLPCVSCGAPITKITQNGRATYFCSLEQK